MKLKATKDFSWAHRGVRVEAFKAGQVFDTDDADLINVAKAEGWAKPASGKEDGAGESKSAGAAPENK